MANPDTVDAPVVVNDIKWQGQLKQAAIYLGIICTAIPTIIAIVANRNIADFVNFIRSEQGIQFLSAVSFFALIVWRQIEKRREIDKAVFVAKPSPVAVLKSEVAAAAPGDVS